MAPDIFFPAAVAALITSAITTIPAVIAHTGRVRKAKQESEVYQDEDGEATPETTAKFSTKWQKAHILLWAAAGLGCQIAFSVLLNTFPQRNHNFAVQNWLITASWGLLGIQAISIAALRDSTRAYNQGAFLAVAGLAVGSLLLTQLNAAQTWYGTTGKTALILCIGSATSAGGLVFASVLLPRRPDVFSNGKLVDRMYTVSLFNRLTYGWATTLMLFATKKKDLDLADIPRLNRDLRPSYQSEQWKQRKQESLYRSLLRIYGWGVFKQFTGASVTAAISYLPWWVTLRLLQALETRRPGQPMEARLWLYLVWLGIANIASSVRTNRHREYPSLSPNSWSSFSTLGSSGHKSLISMCPYVVSFRQPFLRRPCGERTSSQQVPRKAMTNPRRKRSPRMGRMKLIKHSTTQWAKSRVKP